MKCHSFTAIILVTVEEKVEVEEKVNFGMALKA